MKLVSTFLLIFAVTFSSYSLDITDGHEDPNQAMKAENNGGRESEKNQEQSSEQDLNEDEEIDESQIVESDSSYYSVNKFNILFYLVYKLKYGEEESVSEE